MEFFESTNQNVEKTDTLAHNAGDVPHNDKKRGFIPWPKLGSGAGDLVKAWKFVVFIDASFVKSDVFSVFAQNWNENKGRGEKVRNFYIPEYEFKKLSEQETALLTDDCCIIPGIDFGECLDSKTGGIEKINVLFITAENSNGFKAQCAAKEKGVMLRWYGFNAEGRLMSFYNPDKPESFEKQVSKKPFQPSKTFAQISMSTNSPTVVPKTGEKVLAVENETEYLLKTAVMTDATSITYTTNDVGFFAKIYTAQALKLDVFENKAKLMLKEDVNIKGVCWPRAILTNSSGAFVGILVQASSGVQMTRAVLNGASGLEKFFPDWNKSDICDLAYTILDTICKVHKLGVLLGCFNPATVYIVDKDEVYFVDVDNWQVEGYPVMSRNITFTPPELVSEEKKPHLYTIDEENYQIALLAFMLMMPGKYPYAKRKNNNEIDCIRDMAFPFSVGGDMRRSADAERPSGVWQIVWDHLSYKLCDSFYNSFHSGGKFSRSGTRLKDYEWVNMIGEYKKHLSFEQNSDSRELFPHTFRRDGKRIFEKCDICGKQHPVFYFLRNIRIQGEKVNVWEKGYRVCLPCAVDQSEVSFTCRSCDRTFYYNNRTKLVHEIGKSDFDWSNQKWCRDCKKQTVRCSQCGADTPIYQIREFEDRMRSQTRSVCGNCFGKLIDEVRSRRHRSW